MTNPTILVADDDRDDWFILEDAMAQIGVKGILQFFLNGEQLVEHLRNSGTTLPCAIVLDLNMPRMNGTEALQRIKEDQRLNNIPVIIYSTSINFLEKKKCLDLGAHDYITKPVTNIENQEIATMLYAFCLKESPDLIK